MTDELRPEYELSNLKGGMQGKYYKQATAGTTLVLLEPDVPKLFLTDGLSTKYFEEWQKWLAYHLKSHPHYRAMKRLAPKR